MEKERDKLRELIERYKQEQTSYFDENRQLQDEAEEWERENKELKAERNELRDQLAVEKHWRDTYQSQAETALRLAKTLDKKCGDLQTKLTAKTELWEAAEKRGDELREALAYCLDVIGDDVDDATLDEYERRFIEEREDDDLLDAKGEGK